MVYDVSNIERNPITNWKTKLQEYQSLTHDELHLLCEQSGNELRASAVRCIALLAESYRRKDFAQRAYSSLAKYALEVLKVPSTSTAYRYAAVAKLCLEFPDVLGSIESGELSLENVALAVAAFREQARKGKTEEEKFREKCELSPELDFTPKQTSSSSSQPISKAQKQEVLDEIKNQSGPSAQKAIARKLEEFTGEPVEKSRPRATVGTRDAQWNELRFFLSDQELEVFYRLRSLLSHKVGETDMNATFLRLISDGIDKYDPVKIEERAQKRRNKNSQPEKNCGSASKPSKAIPTKNSRQMWLNEGLSCTYVDPQSDRVCDSELFIDRDHIRPRAQGGGNETQNLAPLCSLHNRVIKGDRELHQNH